MFRGTTMFYVFLFATFFLPASSLQTQCRSNVSECLYDYNTFVVKPLGLGYIPISKLRLFIRHYNYNNVRNPGRNKRQRRKFRVQKKKNYNFYSFSKELDYISHVCDIRTEKLDSCVIRSIKKKYISSSRNIKDMQMHSHVNDVFVIIIFIYITALLVLVLKSQF